MPIPVLRELSPVGRVVLIVAAALSLAAIAMEYVVHIEGTPLFIVSAAAILGLAYVVGISTERLGALTGPQVGGILNATFGNAAELIIAVLALRAGLLDVVKASITGSIIGNILFVLGASALAGGLKFERQEFNRTAAGLGVTSLVLSAIGLIVPALFHFVVRGNPAAHERELSLEIAIVLFVTYILSLVFALHTHKHLYSGTPAEAQAHDADEALGVTGWSTKKS